MRPEPARASQSQPKLPRASTSHPRITQSQSKLANKNLYFTLLFLQENSYLFLYEVAMATYFHVCIFDTHEMKLIIKWKKLAHRKINRTTE